jgi:hypothetical protein
MQRKVIEAAELKMKREGAGEISGYASTFENFDRTNERPARGAFKTHLPDFLRDGFLGASHNWDQPIGTITEAFEDNHGLWFSADFHSDPDSQRARLVAQERLERGKSVSTSIGYELGEEPEVVKDESLPGGQGLLLKTIRLFEISLVTVPANPLALVQSAKDWLPAGLSLDDHSDAALAAVRTYVERTKALHALRAKEGRTISQATANRLRAVLDAIRGLGGVEKDIEALLELAEPRAEDTVNGKAALEGEWLRLQQRLMAVYRS